jgi:hypothetical protein
MNVFKLYWGNSEDGYSDIGSYENDAELSNAMEEYLKYLKFKNYYYRQWVNDEGFTMCDYGSHINFFKYKEE